MYTITRNEAAIMLNISTRSLDRYIKAWKIRTEKDWKNIYLNNLDIKNIMWNGENISEIIIPKNDGDIKENNIQEIKNEWNSIIKKSDFDKISATFEIVYTSMKQEISKKDEKIEDLSLRLWRAEEIVKNSVNIVEHKKTTFLIEESKNNLIGQINAIKTTSEKLEEELKYEKTTNKLLIAFVIVLVIVAMVIWFSKI